MKDNQGGDNEVKKGINRCFDLDIVVIVFFIFLQDETRSITVVINLLSVIY